MLVGLQKTSLVNFPGRVCAAVFLPGCNLRCPFCHNAELACSGVVSGPQSAGDNEYVTLESVYDHLERRKSVLGGLAISGGEPLLSPVLGDLVRKARELGLGVKIDTNGTLADRLESILSDPDLRPDMIAVDVKTSPARYRELAIEPEAGERSGAELLRSLAILERHASGTAGLKPLRVEYRTVLVPGLVARAELQEIAGLIPRTADWELANFVPGACLDPSWNDLEPYGPVAAGELVAHAKGLVPGVRLR